MLTAQIGTASILTHEVSNRGIVMVFGALALLERSLRIDARAWSPHLTRFGLMAAVYCSLCYSLSMGGMFGAPGLRFFQGIAYLDAAFMTLMGIGFFSTSITEEKEEDTLGLMLMAGISPLGILAGKSVGRLWQSMLLVAVQVPFMLLAVTMGGVTLTQVWSVTGALLAYMVFLAGFGLLCSTLAKNGRSAGTLMVTGLVAYVLIPTIARSFLLLIARSAARGVTSRSDSVFGKNFLEAVSQICVFLRMGDILTTGFGETLWSVQVLSNLLMGIVCGLLSWLLFGMALRNPSTEASTRGFVARRRAFLRFTAGRPRINPFVWKDFHFVAGGIGMVLVRLGFYLGLCILIFELLHILDDFNSWDNFLTTCLVFLSWAVSVDAARLLARAMHDEIRGQTMTSLLLLPRSTSNIVYSKFLGTLLGWLPGVVVLSVLTFMTEPGRRDFNSIAHNEGGGWYVAMLFVSMPHLAAVIALYVRWGAVPLAIGLVIGIFSLISMGASMIIPRSQSTMDFYLLIMTGALICICIACHVSILLRIKGLAAR